MQYTANTLENYWMPFTSNRDFKENPRLIERAEGMYFWNHHGERVLDGSAGMFCVAAGHGRPEIIEAVSAQLAKLDYAPPFQFGHPAAFELSLRLCAILPEDINHVFFCNSGSEAVDTALKIALAYHRARGDGRKTRFVGREKAYHGVNFGGISVAGLVKNREAFGTGLPGVVHLRHTWTPEQRFTMGQPETGAELADDLQRMVDLHGAENMAACIVEPIAGSVGVLVPPKGYLERLREICDAHGILLIFDEVITGFGRTGKAFGTDTFGVIPDMMTLAKGLTNGNVPMGAVAVKDEIYETVVNAAPEKSVEFFHGYTYTACPVACAAGLAALGIYEKEGLFERAAAMAPYFLDRVFSLQDIDLVTDIRGFGLLAGIDLAPGKAPGMRGYEALQRFYEAGLMVKMTGDCILLSPPLVIENAQIDFMVDTIRKVLKEL
ncbi:MAG: aspartate aminotransferase family protein [Proteobacteria bacterium]|nr:aspartate aminotransferase family protein [Pseudomonadota bacterium]